MAELTLAADYVFEGEIKHRTLISTFESGSEQRRKKWSGNKRKFVLRYENRSKADLDTMIQFVLDHSGSVTIFTYVGRDDGVTYTVRFLDDKLRWEEPTYHRYSFEVSVTTI